MDKHQTSIQSLEQDLAEIDKLMGIATRQNIKRQLETLKATLNDQLRNEKRAAEEEKKKAELQAQQKKSGEAIPQAQPKETGTPYNLITKYAIDNTNEYFK